MQVQVVSDANRLVQVLVDQLNNAARYTPQVGSIVLASARHASSVSVSVRDNGIGSDGALRPHVFDRFTQAPRSPDRS